MCSQLAPPNAVVELRSFASSPTSPVTKCVSCAALGRVASLLNLSRDALRFRLRYVQISFFSGLG